jgi:UDP-2,3-diacylglucosamine pyrophosphatase LpxH
MEREEWPMQKMAPVLVLEFASNQKSVWVLHGEGFITTLCKFAIVDLVAVGKMLLSLLLRL